MWQRNDETHIRSFFCEINQKNFNVFKINWNALSSISTINKITMLLEAYQSRNINIILNINVQQRPI